SCGLRLVRRAPGVARRPHPYRRPARLRARPGLVVCRALSRVTGDRVKGDHPMTATDTGRAHLIAGGFPPGSMGGHDHDYARLKLLGLLAEQDVPASVGNDFSDVAKWLP